MARAMSADFITNSRFHMTALSSDGRSYLQRPVTAAGLSQAGFTTCSTPEATVEAKEYREGTFVYARKFPGIPSIGDISAARGLCRLDSSLWDWMRVVLEGSGEYRADISLAVFHRDTALTREFPSSGANANRTEINVDAPAVIFHCHDCFPTMVKAGGDLDAASGEVSIQEITISLETFEVEHFPAP